MLLQVYVKGYRGGINTRTQASLAALHETVITSPEPLPDVEYVTSHPIFSSFVERSERELNVLYLRGDIRLG